MRSEYEIKKEICDIGKRIYDRGMVAANDGNISVKLNDNEFLCTPTGVSKGFMTPDFICKVDKEGKVIQANGSFKPSSEIKMHMRVYQERPDVNAVVHAHPMYATSFAIAGIPLTQPIMLRRLLRLAVYLLPNTEDLLRWRFPMPFLSMFSILMRFSLRITVLLHTPIRLSTHITKWSLRNFTHSFSISRKCWADPRSSLLSRLRIFMRSEDSSACPEDILRTCVLMRLKESPAVTRAAADVSQTAHARAKARRILLQKLQKRLWLSSVNNEAS